MESTKLPENQKKDSSIIKNYEVLIVFNSIRIQTKVTGDEKVSKLIVWFRD